jgi:putative membrane protein
MVVALSLILASYALARTLELLSTPPRIDVVALDVLSALAFALVDGAQHYRLRGILVFAAICTLIGNTLENLSIATGFPFGRYEFHDLMAPKLFKVPILLGLAYIGMAYVSWSLARLIVGNLTAKINGAYTIVLPLVASFIMVAWDLAQDPVWGTILHAWKWHDGGPWFGVPISNYFGWYLTVFLIYLAFALYLRRWPPLPSTSDPLPRWPPVFFYALCAVWNILQVFVRSATDTVLDATGKSWQVFDITAASALVSLLVMGAFAAIAAARLASHGAVRD